MKNGPPPLPDLDAQGAPTAEALPHSELVAQGAPPQREIHLPELVPHGAPPQRAHGLPDLGAQGAQPAGTVRLPERVRQGARPARALRLEHASQGAPPPGGTPLLRELVGEGAPPPTEEAARRARLVALIECLWAGLQGLWRLLASFFARRHILENNKPPLDDKAPLEEKTAPRPEDKKAAEPEDKKGALKKKKHKKEVKKPKCLAWKYDDRGRARHQCPGGQPQTPLPPAHVMVRSESPSDEEQIQYEKYSKMMLRVAEITHVCAKCAFLRCLIMIITI
ncbi:unnamed protein product [Urochloa humidicola]